MQKAQSKRQQADDYLPTAFGFVPSVLRFERIESRIGRKDFFDREVVEFFHVDFAGRVHAGHYGRMQFGPISPGQRVGHGNFDRAFVIVEVGVVIEIGKSSIIGAGRGIGYAAKARAFGGFENVVVAQIGVLILWMSVFWSQHFGWTSR